MATSQCYFCSGINCGDPFTSSGAPVTSCASQLDAGSACTVNWNDTYKKFYFKKNLQILFEMKETNKFW